MNKIKIIKPAFYGRLLAGIALANCFGAAGVAQTAPAGEDAAGADAEGEIIVTAQRRSERLQDVPVTVAVQTAEALQNANIVNARDLTLVTPGVRIEANGVNAQPAIRGVSSTLGSSNAENNVATYIDGVYQPNILGGFYALPDVDQVQILKGPQGSLYGRNATGGVILINSKSPSFTPQAKIGMAYTHYGHGSDGEIMGKAFATGPLIGDVLAGSVTVAASNMDSYVTNVADGTKIPDNRMAMLRAKLLFKPSANLSFEGSFTYSKDYNAIDMAYLSHDGVSAYQGVPGVVITDRPWTTSQDIAGRLKTDYKAYSLKADYEAPFGTFTSLTGYVDLKADILQEADYTNIFFGVYDIDSYSKSFTQDLYFTSERMGPVSLTAGLTYYRRNVGDDPAFINIPAFGYVDLIYDHSINTSLSGFAEVTFHATDRLKVIAGGRYSHDKVKAYWNGFNDSTPEVHTNDVSSNSFTPRAAIMFDATPELNVYYNFAKGFKAGLFNTIARQATPVRPEKISSHEVGAKYRSGPFALNVAGFYYDYKNLQVTSTIGGVSTLQNAASAELYGVDADATLDVSDALRLTLGAAYLHARYKSFPAASVVEYPPSQLADPYFDGVDDDLSDLGGQTMIRAPELTLSANVNYKQDFSGGRLDLSVTGFYSTKVRMALEQRVTQPGYFVGNARIAWTPADTGLTASVFARNFTNEKVISSTFINPSADSVVYSPPRQIGVGIDFAF